MVGGEKQRKLQRANLVFFFPEVEREGVPEGFPWTGFMSTIVVDGHVYAPETQSGLHVLPLPEMG